MQEKEGQTIPIRCDLPEAVHRALNKLRGGKKANAETILINWAKQQEDKEDDKRD